MKYTLALIIAISFLMACNSQNKIVNVSTESVSIPFPESTSEIESRIFAENDIQELDRSIRSARSIALNKEVFDHSHFNALLKKYVMEDGRVNYAGFKKDKKILEAYLETIRTNNPKTTWSKNDRFAYYMNAYNAMTIDLIIKNHPIKSIKNINNPWEQRYWKIGDTFVSLEEIEHDVLRKMKDPRIHFGINCASFSCPPLMNKAFTAATVDTQLEKLAVQFINDPKRNKITTDRVEISKIFRWFYEDFTKNGDLIDFLNTYSKVKIDKNARVRYMDYNWELNE
jgi:hypothetical protein